jgi:thymidylate synthase (FAD)
MHHAVPDTLTDLMVWDQKWLGMHMNEYFEKVLLKDGMPTFLETVSMTFKLEHVSRALTHQLVRHRIGFSYSQQSQRCVRMETFADDGAFHTPDTVHDPAQYETMMKVVQTVYNQALEEGCSTQDARGLLPTNVHTTILFTATLRSLIEMVNKRLCSKTQEEFRSVARQIVELILKDVDPRLGSFFGAPCERRGRCMMEAENSMQLAQGKTEGEQNTSKVCPRYLKLVTKESKVSK